MTFLFNLKVDIVRLEYILSIMQSEKKTERLGFRVYPSLKESLLKKAEKAKRSFSDYIVQVLTAEAKKK